MRAAYPVLCLAAALTPAAAHAAYPNRTLSAVEKNKALPDIHFGVTFDTKSKNALITREWIQRDPGRDPVATDVKELDFSETTNRVLLDLRVGLYHDLELHVNAPIILGNDTSIDFADGVAGNSTIWGMASNTNANDPTYDYRFPITTVPASRERAGFGDMRFGLSWSPFVDVKDEAFPTLTLTGDIIAPTGGRREPTDQSALPGSGSTGKVGMGQTIFDLSMGLSKRMSIGFPTLDPYFIFGVQLPIANAAQKAIGMQPSSSGRFKIGTEVLLFEQPKKKTMYALDFSFGVRYVGQARTYSELSDYLPNYDQKRPRALGGGPTDQVTYADYADASNYSANLDGASCGLVNGVPCGELNRVDEYLTFSGAAAVHIQPSEFFFIRGGMFLSVTSDHVITGESVGKDTDPASAVNASCGGAECFGRVNSQNSVGEDERSQYYDPRYDVPGRRLRVEDVTTLGFFITGTATF